MISDAGQGQPGWLHGWFSFWTNLQRPEVAFFAYAVAAAETLIAVAVILGFARKITYISAAVFSVLIWRWPKGSAGRTPPARPTSAPRSSMPWCSWACWR
jgi:nitrite reductase (NO-forming)